MDFSFSEDQLAIQELAEKIISDRSTDEFWQSFNWQDGFDQTLWTSLAEAGLLGISIPEEYGGSALGFVELCLILIVQGKCIAPLPLICTLVLGAMPLAKFGNDKQKQRWLSGIAGGSVVVSAAVNEHTGTPALAPVKAAQTSQGWQLNGVCDGVAYAKQAQAILIPASLGDKMAIFLVDSANIQEHLEAQETTNNQPAARLELTDFALTDDDLLCGPDTGSQAWEWLELHWLAALSAVQLGVAEEALRRTAEYVGERKQFGVSISSFQSVRHRAADAYIDVEAMRTTLWQAVWRLSENRLAQKEVCAAKWWAAYGGHRVAHTAQHLHGGIGSDTQYPLHRYYLWAKQLEFTGGHGRLQIENIGQILANDTGK